MRVVNGMHLSNHRHWFIEDQIAASKPTGALTILHHLMFARDELADQWGDPENEYWFCKLRDGWAPQGIPAAPERLIHVRMFHSQWTNVDPVVWAQHAVDKLSRVESGGKVYDLWTDPFVAVSAANEQNLHYECGDPNAANQPRYQTVAWYEKIAAWNLAFWREVDRLRPDRKALSCWSALAYGHEPPGTSPDAEYQIPAIREAIGACDLGASHPYGHLNWADGWRTVDKAETAYFHLFRPFRPANLVGHNAPLAGELGQFPGKSWLFTECGTFSHSHKDKTDQTLDAMRRFLADAAMSGQVLGCTWFIGNTDAAHADNNIGSNDELRRALADLQEYRTICELPAAGETPEPQPDIPEPTMPPIIAGATRRTDKVADEMLAKAQRVHEKHGVPINPESAFCKAARVDVGALLPTTAEFDLAASDGIDYVGQRFERPVDNEVAVVFAKRGEWGTLWYTRRGDPIGEPVSMGTGKAIDVSHWQGLIDWQAVARDGVTHAYIKASEGTGFLDKRFARNWREAGGAGIKRGAYHYWHAENPGTQARHFRHAVGDDIGELPPAVDCESNYPRVDAADLRRCLVGVETEFGVRPVIYTASWWWNSARFGGRVAWAPEYKLWVASYRSGQPVWPSDWPDWWLWQYTNAGRVDGISGNVDCNRFA